MNNTLLISEQILKRDSLINDNVDDMYILPAITVAQDQKLQPIIGTALFEKLKSLVADGTISNTSNKKYKDLLDDYIVKFLEWQVLSDIQIPLAWKTRNAGIVTNYDNSFNNNYNKYMDNVQYIKNYYEDKANFYSLRLSDFLIANSSNYPEYYEYQFGQMPSNKDAYNTHIYLGNSKICEDKEIIIINNTNNNN